MTRELKGIIGFISLTIIAITAIGFIFSFNATTIALGGVLVFAFMVAREIFQYKTKQTTRFEYEDVVEYGIFIAFTTALYLIVVALFKSI